MKRQNYVPEIDNYEEYDRNAVETAIFFVEEEEYYDKLWQKELQERQIDDEYDFFIDLYLDGHVEF